MPVTKRKPVKDAESPLARRKLPQQQRAHLTVNSILQATAELVRAKGFANVGTRQIAERAGVNVGSLYHYFPTYEAILLAWYEEVSVRVAQKMKMAMLEIAHESLDVAVPYTMKLLLSALEENELVLVRMPDEVAEIRRATHIASFERLIRSSMRMYFNQHHKFRTQDTERHVFFIEAIIFGSMHRYLADRPHKLSRKEFIAQLSRIQIAYLEGDLTQ